MAEREPTHYIFTINGTEQEFNDRLSKGLWPVYFRTSHVGNLRKGDRVVFYRAGQGNHIFAGTSSVDGVVGELPKKYVKISNTDPWKKPVDITTIFDKLSFIGNKYAYGVYLVNGIRKVTKQDFDSIVSSRKK